MSAADESRRFERVDWETVGNGRRFVSAERMTFVVGGALLFALYLYDTYVAHVYTVGDWRARPVDWVFLVGVVILLAYGGVPAIRNRTKVGRIGRRLVSKPVTLLAGVYLAIFAVVGFLGPVIFSNPGLQYHHAFHPPVGFSSQVPPLECLGETTGVAFDRRCYGSLSYPLGTNERGHPMGFLLATGARVALYVVVFTAVFVVPLATAVGVVAGVRGGLLDDLLMAYVDIQLSIPAIILYFIGYAYWNPSLLLLLVTFGLLSWGGIARLVRSEVLQRREDGYVLVARSLGAPESYIAKRHIVPNVTNTLVPAVFHLFAMLVLIEAGIAFLGFYNIEFYSWGSAISESVNAVVPGHVQNRAEYPAYQIWWVSTLPALALTLTMLSFKLVGDGIRDALDPRQQR